MSDSINNAIDVVYQTEISIENKTTEQLTVEANVQYKQAENLAAMSMTMLADVGRKITEIKNRIPHGEFEDWCAKNLVFSKRQAEQYMKLASRMDDQNSIFSKTQTFADIGISRVWALLAAPEEVAAEVIETHDVTDMTVRELKDEIKRLKEERDDAIADAVVQASEESTAKIADLRNSLRGIQDELRFTKAEKQGTEERAERLHNKVEELRGALEEANEKAAEYDEEAIEKIKAEASEREEKMVAEISDTNAKLEKAKEDLKKAKEKLKAAKESQEEEIKKGVEAARPEIEKKAKDDALAESSATMAQNAEDIKRLEEQVKKLEAEKAKLSNTGLMEFKILCDELQDIYHKINEVIDRQDDDLAQKMYRALNKLTEGWGL